jgi:phage-related protein
MAGKTIRIRFDGENKGLILSARGAENALDRFQDKVVGGFGNMVKGGAALALKLSNVATGLQAAGAAGGALAAASGALIAAPAAAAAYATVLGAVKLGQEGAARAGERFVGAISGVKDAVSSSYEKALNPAVDKAAKLVQHMQKPFQAIVTTIGGMATQAANVATLPKNLEVANTVGMGTARMLGNLRGAVAPLVQAFFDLVSVAAPGLGKIGANAGSAAQSFADWIAYLKESGKLAAAMGRGFDVIKQIGAVLQDVLGIVVNLITGIASGAGGLGGVFGPLLNDLNRFLGSAEGQQVLGQLGAALTQVGAAVSAVVMPALRAVTPLIGPLAGLFAQVTTRVSELLVPLIEFLAPGLEAIAGWIERNTSWLTPLAIAVGVVTGAVWLFNAALAANPIGLIILAIAALVLAFVSLWRENESFRNFFIVAWSMIRNAVSDSVKWITDKWNGLMDFFRGIPGWFDRIGEGIANGVKNGFKAAVNWIVDRLNWLVDRANDLIRGVNSVLPGNGIPTIPRIPGMATGGTVLRGGLVEVGERGREIVSLPAGATVTPNRETEALLGGGTGDVHVYIGVGEFTELVDKRVVRLTRASSRVAAMAPGGGR